MKVKTSNAFREKFSLQVRYIAQDKPKTAKNFKNEVFSEIRIISKMLIAIENRYFLEKKIYET